MRKNYIKDRAQAAVIYITEYSNTTLWNLENLVPVQTLAQRLQIVFGRTNAVREAIDRAIEQDNAIRRRNCMHYLKPPKRFLVPEDMQSEETATWISWIHVETQSLLEDSNKEIRLQNEEDDPFTKGIVYAPTGVIQDMNNVISNKDSSIKDKFGCKISPQIDEQHEEKLVFPLPLYRTNNPLPQRLTNKHVRR